MNNEHKINQFFNDFLARVEKSKDQLPIIVGTEVVNSAQENFHKQGFDGKKWKPLKNKKDSGRKILLKSAMMLRSITIIRTTPTSVIVGTQGVPYAQIHNEGGVIKRAARSETFVRNRYVKGKKSKYFGGMGAFKKGTSQGKGLTFKAYSITMPQRQFLGFSPSLLARIKEVAKREIEDVVFR